MSFFRRIQPKQWLVLIIFALLLAYVIHKASEKGGSHTATSPDALNVGLDRKVATLDPRLIGGDPNAQYLEELLFSPLVSFDNNGNLKNVLAQSITSKDGKRWTIKLKDNVHFRNGDVISSEDIIGTYLFLMTPPPDFPASPRRGSFSEIESLRSINTQSVQIVLKHPDASFATNLVIGIMPKEALELPPNKIWGQKFESGPFCLKSMGDTLIHLKKNNSYDLNMPAKMKDIYFRIIANSSTRFASLSKGDIDLIQNSLDPDKIQLIEKTQKKKFNVLKKTRLATYYIGFNFRNPVLKNLKIRQAMAYAMSRRSILKYRLHSSELPATGMFPPGNEFFDRKLVRIGQNKKLARKLIQESGVKKPLAITLKMPNTNKFLVEVAKAISADFADVGIKMTVEPLENGIFLDQLQKGQVAMWLSSWVGFKDPDHLRFVFASDMVPPHGGNRGHFQNSKIDDLLSQGRTILVPQQRKKVYNTAQGLLAKQLPYLYLWHGENIAVVKKNIKNFKIYADGRYASLKNVEKTVE